jgi:hypothetical protein
MTRQPLTNRRHSEVYSLDHGGHAFTVGCSRYPDGRLAEIFIDARKGSSAVADAARDAAVLASIALQHGCPSSVLRHALTRNSEHQAAGPVGAALDLIEGGQSHG